MSSAPPADSCCSSAPEWAPSPHDRRRLEEPLNLHTYTSHWRQDLGVSPLHYPHAIKGSLLLPRLDRMLEAMRQHRDMRDRVWKTTWFENGYLKIRENTMFIRELAVCSMHVVKLVLSYFPAMRVCACSAYFDEPNTSSLSTQMALLVHGCRPQHLTLVRENADGSRSVARCLPPPPDHNVQWEPFDAACL